MKPNPETIPTSYDMEPSPSMDVVPIFIAYDHPDSARRAVHLTQRLASQLASRMKIRPNLWRIDLLNAPGGYEAGLRWAADADVLLVAMKGSTDLPDSVRSWLAEVLMQRGHQRTALVALFDGEDGPDSNRYPAVQRLTSLAKDTGADLFTHPADRLFPDSQWLIRGAHSSPYRWGINE